MIITCLWTCRPAAVPPEPPSPRQLLGIGSAIAALVAGGMLLGLAENLAYWKLDPQWSEAVTFVVLFAFIIFRPSGFFGSPTAAR